MAEVWELYLQMFCKKDVNLVCFYFYRLSLLSLHNCIFIVVPSFTDSLFQIERRYAVDDEAYWDFRALDANGNDHIALTDALLLFQEYHGDQFSLSTWHSFLKTREIPGRIS